MKKKKLTEHNKIVLEIEKSIKKLYSIDKGIKEVQITLTRNQDFRIYGMRITRNSNLRRLMEQGI